MDAGAEDARIEAARVAAKPANKAKEAHRPVHVARQVVLAEAGRAREIAETSPRDGRAMVRVTGARLAQRGARWETLAAVP